MSELPALKNQRSKRRARFADRDRHDHRARDSDENVQFDARGRTNAVVRDLADIRTFCRNSAKTRTSSEQNSPRLRCSVSVDDRR
jgi:hypothetical protein